MGNTNYYGCFVGNRGWSGNNSCGTVLRVLWWRMQQPLEPWAFIFEVERVNGFAIAGRCSLDVFLVDWNCSLKFLRYVGMIERWLELFVDWYFLIFFFFFKVRLVWNFFNHWNLIWFFRVWIFFLVLIGRTLIGIVC